MIRKISTFALTSAIAASLQFSVTASADNHEIADRVRPAGILVISEATAAPAEAQGEIPGGDAAATDAKAIYDTSCFACHGTGAAGAPVLGNKDAWSARIALGNDSLYANAINGKGGMPAKGGAASLSDDEVKAVVDYMVAQSQ